MFSGGSYDEVARWLRVFLNSHAKREHPRVEVVLDEDDALRGRAYRARLRFGDRMSEPMELDFREVADHRGELAWCAALAARARAQARSLLSTGSAADARAR
ncbi:MAG TPA: hypothetical protein VN646_10150 [Candidatus Acidoferrum sp.]|jgi:hypothetical protein|nr:hypothetical protein [Candidatus Acidoferrum sp.]